MKIRALFASFVLSLALAASAFAQTSLTSTTLSTAVNADVTTFVVASATNIDAGDYLFIDREAALVQSVAGTQVRVTRGFAGTAPRAHAASSIVYVGAPSNFYSSEVVGTCTATAEEYTPRIVLPTGNVYSCTGGWWNRLGDDIGTITATYVQGSVVTDATDRTIFAADRPYVVTKVVASWSIAESTGTMPVMVEKLTGTTACASGTDLLSSGIAATGTANTTTAGTLTTTAANLFVAAGDRLCVDLDNTPNEIANLVVVVTLAPR